MANYYASARSNYFLVKDADAFQAWAKRRELGIWSSDKEGGRVAIYPLSGDDNGWPSCRYNDETDEYDDFSVVEELPEHLVEGEVAVLMEVGAEKLRYLVGHAIAVNAAGEVQSVNLQDAIMELAKTMGPNVTEPCY